MGYMNIWRRMSARTAMAAICLMATGGALAQECTQIDARDVAQVMHRAADELSGRVPPPQDGTSVLADDLITFPDIYLENFDQFVPQVYRGRDDWDRFRQSLAQPAWQDFRIDSIFARSGCRVSIVTGRFDIGETDEYLPWFYAAQIERHGDQLLLSLLRLPSPVPRKRTGDGDPCLAETPDPAVLADLRDRFLAALRSGDDAQIAKLFSPSGAFAIFDPTFDERVRGFEQAELARQATATFFRGAVIEDLPQEHRAVQRCANLEFGGILSVTMSSGATIPIGYRNYAFLKIDPETPSLTHLKMTLLAADIVQNLPEVEWQMLKDAEAEIRAWVPAQ